MQIRRWMVWTVVAAAAVAGAWMYREQVLVERGSRVFLLRCAGCHLAGAAPSVVNAINRLHKSKLRQFITDPDSVYRERGMKPLNAGHPRMPPPGASETEVDEVVAYLATLAN